MRGTWRGYWGLVLALWGVGCGDGSAPDSDTGVPPMDSGPEVILADTGQPRDTGPPDGAEPCESDADCDDGIDCTFDVCEVTGYCRRTANTIQCDDGIFCNGVELCDLELGCVPGPARTCNDNNVCTIDRCDETAQVCLHSPRDFDEDGEADWRCAGGTDCDDFDPTRGSRVPEICADDEDNDCDGEVDEAGCGRPQHDTCSDALDVSAGGVFLLNNEGANADYTLGCGGGGRRDVALAFTLEEAKDVSILAEGTNVTWLAIRELCSEPSSEVDCALGFPGQLRVRSLPPGAYFVIIADAGTGEIQVSVDFAPPTDPPTNESCEMPEDVSAGGRFDGSFLDTTDDVDTCGVEGSPDLVYQFTLEESRNVLLSASASTGDDLTIAVRTACEDAATSLRCTRGSPVATTLHSLGPGTYFVIVEGPAFRENDFTLDVSFEPPSAPPEGDTCSDPIALPLNETISGTFADKQDDLEVQCGSFYRDAVYTFDLDEHSDLVIEVDGGDRFVNFSLRTACDDGATALRCVSGRPAETSVRYAAPGQYFLIVETARGAGFDVTVDAVPATEVPVVVEGNNDCGSAYAVPDDGGLFFGDTSGQGNSLETSICGAMAASPDAAYVMDVAVPTQMVATTAGSTFDTVLHMHQGMCMTRAELVCDDDGGSDNRTSRISRELAPGTWYLIVDGWGPANAGDYTLDISLTP